MRKSRTDLIAPQSDREGVCGSDHVTYRNECDLRRAACVKSSNITVISQLPCGESDKRQRTTLALCRLPEVSGKVLGVLIEVVDLSYSVKC